MNEEVIDLEDLQRRYSMAVEECRDVKHRFELLKAEFNLQSCRNIGLQEAVVELTKALRK